MATTFTASGGAHVEFSTEGGFRVELASGPRGAQGEQGIQGEQGPQGPMGAQGPAGDGSGVPAGGTTGQVLTKLSDDDGDADWEDAGGTGVPAGGLTGQFLKKNSDADGDADWSFVYTSDVVLPFSIASFTVSPASQVERGQTLSLLTAAATYVEGPPTVYGVTSSYGGSSNVGDIALGAWSGGPASFSASGTVKRLGSLGGADPTITMLLTADSLTSSRTISWLLRGFWGVGAAALTESGIEALAGTGLKNTKAFSFQVTPTNEKIYLCYPSHLGALSTITVNGFASITDFTLRTLSITNAYGVVNTINIYESNDLVNTANAMAIVGG